MAKNSNNKQTDKTLTSTQNTPASLFFENGIWNKYLIASIVLVILSFVMYRSATEFGYVLDDLVVIRDNKFTKSGFDGIGDILSKESFVGYFGERKDLVQGNRYRPLSLVTFAFERGVLGEFDPNLSHMINIFLYGIAAILFMICCSMMFRDSNRTWYLSVPFVAALIWLCHPVHVEAVANIKGRDEVLVMIFGMLSLYTGMRYVDTKKISFLVGSFLTFFLACLSKENALTFALIIPLTVYWYNDGTRSRNMILGIGLMAVSLLFVILRTSIVGTFIGKPATDLMNNPFLGMTTLERMGSTMYSLGKYLQLLVFPHPLTHDYYPYAIPKTSLMTLVPILSTLAYLGLGFLAWRGWKNKSTYAYAILFFVLSLAMMSNIVLNVGTFMNERFIFVASAGFSIACAYFLIEQLPKWISNGRYIGLGIALVISALFAWKTMDRVPDWENNKSLNLSAVEAYPNSARANSFLATAYFEEYKDKFPNIQAKQIPILYDLLDKTEDYANRAVKIIPDYLNANLMVVGVATERFKNEYDVKLYIKTMTPVILRRPDIPFIKDFSEYINKTGNDGHLFPFYKYVGQELLKTNDNRKIWAAQYLAYAHTINPNDADVMDGMSKAYAAAGNVEEAKRWADAATNTR
jgi:hypothetical protein